MIRCLDLLISINLIIISAPLMIIIYFLILIIDKVNPIYLSKRIGKSNKIFLMPKFRTMKKNTEQLSTDKFTNHNAITKLGNFLRFSSLDEIPQLFTVLTGKMSLVGPRPALYNQYDLISQRTKKGIDNLVPGITGYAQINGRDQISDEKKVNLDEFYLKKKSLKLYVFILYQTILYLLKGKKNIKH